MKEREQIVAEALYEFLYSKDKDAEQVVKEHGISFKELQAAYDDFCSEPSRG